MEQTEKFNLLLVDDNAGNLLALSVALNREDYNLETANNGKAALELLSQKEFVVVLLDVRMPEMDGFEVAARMKETQSSRHVPILFISAIAHDVKDILKGYAVGGADYIFKPFEREIVRAKVAVFVELFRQRKLIERQAKLIRDSARAQFLKRERSARIRAQEAERRFRNLVNALDHAIIWEASPNMQEFTFISDNVEAILGYPRDQWLSEPEFFKSHVNSDDLPAIQQCVSNSFNPSENNLGQQCVHRISAADGTEKWFHTGISSELDAGGNPVKLRGLWVDMNREV